MINSLEYTKGNIQVKIDGHRYVLESAKTLPSGEKVKQSPLVDEPPIVRAVAEAVLPLRKRSEGTVRFCEATGIVKWNGQVITPESPLSKLPNDVKAFCQAVRTPETIATFNAAKGPEYVLEEYTDSRVVLVEGEPTLIKERKKRPKTRRIQVKNEDGTLAFRDKEGKEPIWYDEPILKIEETP